MNEQLRDKIIAEIAIAFAEVQRCGNTSHEAEAITLHEADVVDDYGSADDRQAARNQDTELHWQEIQDSVIEANNFVFSFLCPHSFHYYIAPYMVWSLRHYMTSDSISSDFTIYALAPNGEKPPDSWKLERFKLFSPLQARAVQRYLQFMVDHGDGRADDRVAKQALNMYWNEAATVA